ncbi:hypothetical protein ACA910_012481 [Epithemia clementina (nom. ined.)]
MSKNKQGRASQSRKDHVGGGEVQVQKSPAEFFAEHQAIAGFDNAGKSLFTSLRELVENGLDAAESIHQLPEIDIEIRELTMHEFNVWRGDSPAKKVDPGLYVKKGESRRKSNAANANGEKNMDDTGGEDGNAADDKKKRRKAPQEAYFELSVKDNGCGMSHNAIPNLLGRVLSGSKYGVRQTRGKFGLGSKMALIWSKKSTGMPIEITTSHRPRGGPPADSISYCKLDIDIHENEPRILKHTRSNNSENWLGTRVQLMIAGNWTTYKSRILQYLQQLAIITPYAQLTFQYSNESEPKRDMKVSYARRSDQMPPPAKQVKHHPASVNNLIIQQLIQQTKAKTLVKFLSSELASVSSVMAKKLLTELHVEDEEMSPKSLSDKKITRLVQVLRSVHFKNPDGSCLSPLGEYNLNLGIRKVLEPDYVATARDRPSAYEGHPFLVEAAVSLGGSQVKEGLTVVRFANRIPLLFEGGADVATRVAQGKIKWSNYKIDHKRDRIGVFVSIVSTKIPFKGTSKEYIGDDATEIQQSVKRALQACCQQLRVHLTKRNALKEAKERKSRLAKYIPDVSRSIMGILNGMRKRQAEDDSASEPISSGATSPSPKKRLKLAPAEAADMIRKLERNVITQKTIDRALREAIDEQLETQEVTADTTKQGSLLVSKPLYLVPLYNMDDPSHDIKHPFFTFRPIKPVKDLTIL